MAWELLPADYTDAVWSGLKKYKQVDNPDGTVSFQDVTDYTGKDNSFFGAKDANRMNETLNNAMSTLENGVNPAVATVDTLGVVKPDGSTISVTPDGTIYVNPAAPGRPGLVKPDDITTYVGPMGGYLYINTNDLLGEHNAGVHNSIYRGKYLGKVVSDAQYKMIADGTFKDLYIGDYWSIGRFNYRIAAFDYYYNTGDTPCTTHHVTLVPHISMSQHVMNDTSTTAGAYVGSKMYKEGLNQAKTTIQNAFGEAHILNHRQLLTNAVTGKYASANSWYDSTVELMTEQNVVGCRIYGNVACGTSIPNNATLDKSQFPLFVHRPDLIEFNLGCWLRDVASDTAFSGVNSQGMVVYRDALEQWGICPAFSIKA